VVGLRPGISNVIARFLVDGAPMSASTQITVLFAIFAAAPVVESGSRLPLQPQHGVVDMPAVTE
jgi:hypothetical protein